MRKTEVIKTKRKKCTTEYKIGILVVTEGTCTALLPITSFLIETLWGWCSRLVKNQSAMN